MGKAGHQVDDHLSWRLVLVQENVHLLRDRHLDPDAVREIAYRAGVANAFCHLLRRWADEHDGFRSLDGGLEPRRRAHVVRQSGPRQIRRVLTRVR